MILAILMAKKNETADNTYLFDDGASLVAREAMAFATVLSLACSFNELVKNINCYYKELFVF